MKIAICDDSRVEQEKIRSYILQYSDVFMLNIVIETFNSGEELLSVFQKSSYKIIFLDIFMSGLSGVDTAFSIRKVDENCNIIFITTSNDHRSEGFEVGAIHYLLKPLTFLGVEVALNRCKRTIAESEKYFNIKVDRTIVKILMKDVIYTEVYGKTVHIHTIHEIFKTYTPLSKIAVLLNDDHFLCCHRCYIVNMQFIAAVKEDCFQLQTGETIPLRRNGRQQSKDEYSNYLFVSLRNSYDS